MSDLTPQDLSIIAEAVTGRSHYWVDRMGMRGVFDLPENEMN